MSSTTDGQMTMEEIGDTRALEILAGAMHGSKSQVINHHKILLAMAQTIIANIAFNQALDGFGDYSRNVGHSKLSDASDGIWMRMRQYEKEYAAGEFAFKAFDDEDGESADQSVQPG